jgi:hypothetical protein
LNIAERFLNLKKCTIEQKPKGLKIEGVSPKPSSKETPNTFYNAKIKIKCFLKMKNCTTLVETT